MNNMEATSALRGIFYPVRNDDRRAMFLTAMREINQLLGLEISLESQGSCDVDSFINDLGASLIATVQNIEEKERAEAMEKFIVSLAADRDHPAPSFVNDVMEILFLSRDRRTEYVTNTDMAPPYKIGKLMIEYAMKSRMIDDIVSATTKGFCASNCDRLPTGCCAVLGYDLGLVPEAMLSLQELEASMNGWTGPAEAIERKCRYHTATGCAIALTKSPACVGYLCENLLEHLRRRYPPTKLGVFFDNLVEFRNCDIDRRRVFEVMDVTIAAGRNLIAIL